MRSSQLNCFDITYLQSLEVRVADLLGVCELLSECSTEIKEDRMICQQGKRIVDLGKQSIKKMEEMKEEKDAMFGKKRRKQEEEEEEEEEEEKDAIIGINKHKREEEEEKEEEEEENVGKNT